MSLEGAPREDLNDKLSQLIDDLGEDYEPTPQPAEPLREKQRPPPDAPEGVPDAWKAPPVDSEEAPPARVQEGGEEAD